MKTLHTLEKTKAGYLADFGDEPILVESEIVLKYRLNRGMTIDLTTYQHIIDDNGYLHFYKKGVYKLKRMMTEHEMHTYLEQQGAMQHWIKQILFQFAQKKYIDDALYAKTFVDMKKYSYGPDMIRNKLKEKGVHPAHIESALSTYDAMDILDRHIEKKIQAKTQKPKAQLVRSLKTYFMQKGYSLESVDHALQKYQHLYQGDEMRLIQKDYQKLEKKYASKLSGYELSETIKQKLYAKGYPYDLIKKVIS